MPTHRLSPFRTTHLAVAALVTAFLVAPPASAAPITFVFTGSVFSVHPDLVAAGLPIAGGDPLSGRFTFESTTPDADPSPESGDYSAGLLGFQVTLGSYSTGMGSLEELALLDGFAEVYFVATDPVASQGFDASELRFGLVNSPPNQGGLEGDSLPLTPPDPTAFETALLALSFGIANNIQVLASVETLTLPEPPPASLLAWVVTALAAYRGRRKSV